MEEKFNIEAAVRQNTPLIIGLAGPTKSGKTYSGLRVATGLAAGGKIVMLNAEGKRGHQYADKFSYLGCDIEAPFRPARYTAALKQIAELSPACVIIDSASHMWDGPGGILEYHDEEVQRMSKGDTSRANNFNFAGWIKPKAEENQFIYQLLAMKCPVVLCFRAKEKIKVVPGKPPIDLGWQPIASERVAFETIFTLVFPPHGKGVPDLSISEMREPFDTLVPSGKAIDESLGETLRKWSEGGKPLTPVVPAAATKPQPPKGATATGLHAVVNAFGELGVDSEQLAEKMGHPISETTDAELILLREIYTQMKKGGKWPSIQEAK